MGLTATTAPGQSEPKSNDNEEVLHTPLELEPHHQLQFSFIPRTVPILDNF